MADCGSLTMPSCACASCTCTWEPRTFQKSVGVTLLIVYIVQLLEYGTCSNNTLINPRENSTVVEPLTPVTSETVHQSEDGPDTYGDNMDTLGYRSTNLSSRKSSKSNNVLSKLGLDRTILHSLYTNKTHASVALNVSTTETPTAFTRRDIYIRGHLLKHPAPARKSYHPPVNSGLSRGPQSGEPLARVQNPLDGTDTSGRQKRKHSSREETNFYNYKLLYDTIKGGGQERKNTGFYAWVFGAAMLAFGSVTTVTSCFVFWFCGRGTRKQRAAHARRPSDKAGEYQRVESVSSIVDHGGDPLETIYEEPTDSVTII